MGTSDETPKKSSAQKGQGMLEYALMMSFVAMVYLIVFADGGFGDAITGTFDNANETLAMASEKSSSGDFGDGSASGFVNSVLGSSSSSSSGSSSGGGSSSTLADMDSAEYALVPEPKPKPKQLETLDWHTIIEDIELTYKTITLSSTPNRAIASEYNLFGQVASLVANKQEYIYAGEDLKGWNELMAQMESQMKASNFEPKYKRGSEKFSIERVGTDNAVKVTYYDGTNDTSFYVFADNGNEMHFTYASEDGPDGENAFNKYLEIAPKIYSGGWSYDR